MERTTFAAVYADDDEPKQVGKLFRAVVREHDAAHSRQEVLDVAMARLLVSRIPVPFAGTAKNLRCAKKARGG
jgi:hypothetical protein